MPNNNVSVGAEKKSPSDSDLPTDGPAINFNGHFIMFNFSLVLLAFSPPHGQVLAGINCVLLTS